MVIVYLGRWLLPVNEKPIEDAFVCIENGIIRDYGRRSEFADIPGSNIVDLGESIVMPGFINAHTHLELSALRGKVGKSTNFMDWVIRLAMRRYTLRKRTTLKGIVEGISEAVASGTVALADVTNSGITVSFLESKGIYARVFHEIYELSDRRAERKYMQKKKQIADYPYNPDISHHIAPHAPYSVSPVLLEKIRDNEKLVSVHLAESRDEVEFINHGRGRIRNLLVSVGYLRYGWKGKGLTPVQYLDSLGLLGKNTLAVHVVCVDDDDIMTLKERDANVCLCVRSNEWVGVGRPFAKKLLDSGINIALGTDSLASNSDLSLLNEMRSFSNIYPEIALRDIVRMATMGGAIALGLDSRLGSIEVGKAGKLISIKSYRTEASDPYDPIFRSGNPSIRLLDRLM